MLVRMGDTRWSEYFIFLFFVSLYLCIFVSLYELFYLFVLKFILSMLKLLFAQDKKIKIFLDNDRIIFLNIF